MLVVILLAAAVLGLFVGLGLLLTKVTEGDIIGRVDHDLAQWLFGHRSESLNTVTYLTTFIAETIPVSAAGLALMISARLAWKRWRDALFVLAALSGEVLIFLGITMLVDRNRPKVPHLDIAPPTSSFPSGHTAATVVLWGAIAVLTTEHCSRNFLRKLAVTMMFVAPVVLGLSRMYRGMHFLSDVIAGALLGAVWLFLALRGVRHGGARRRELGPGKGHTRGVRTARSPCPAGRDDQGRSRRDGDDRGDRSRGRPRMCLRRRRHADGLLAQTNVPLAVLPGGTGNLLAINFDIPLELEDAVDVALNGERRRIDVGATEHHRFAIMCGLGFDAAMLRDTSEQLKACVGALAYVVSGLRNLRRPATQFTIVLDGKQTISSTGQAILVGNVGRVQGGLAVLPDADPCDGLLDVAVVEADGIAQWVKVVYRVMFKRHKDDRHVRFFQARAVEVHADCDFPLELDGEVLGDTDHLNVRILEAALVLCVPAGQVSGGRNKGKEAGNEGVADG